MKNTLSLLKALSDKNRLRVVAALLSTHELCACQIKELLKITGASVSRHLALLIQVGLVDSRKKGRWVYYRLRPEAVARFGAIAGAMGGGIIPVSPRSVRVVQPLV